MPNAHEGLLLIGHGTRDARGLDEFRAMAELVARRLPDVAVEHCFLELAEPTILAGVERLAARDARRIVAVPMLLFAAGHAKQDIPATLATARLQFPAISIQQAEHLGCHSALLDLSAARYCTAIQSVETPTPDATERRVLLVGRGNQDTSAQEEMRRYARLLSQRIGGLRVDVCYLAMARPSFEEALSSIAENSDATIVVQPHLLFYGELLTILRRRVTALQSTGNNRWLLAEHLGPNEGCVDAVVERFRSVRE